jgi:hypothetical protein
MAGDIVTIEIGPVSGSAVGDLTITPPSGQPITYQIIAEASVDTILDRAITASAPYGTWTATFQLNQGSCVENGPTVATFTVKEKPYYAQVGLSGLPPSVNITLQVDGLDHTTIRSAQTVEVPLLVDTPHKISVDMYSSEAVGERYYCSHNTWSVNSKSSHIFNYQPQYELSVVTGPANLEAATDGGGWFDAGTSVTFQANESFQRPGAQYVFKGWEVDGVMLTGNPVSLIMNKPHTAIATYDARYELSVATDPGNLPAVTSGGWFDAGASVQTFQATESFQRPGAQYVFKGWEVDGVMLTGNPVSLIMNEPHTAVAKYDVRYELTVDSPNALGNPKGSGYYETGSTANFSVETPSGFLVEQVFVRWIGDYNGTSPEGSIVMTKPMVVHAIWTTSYQRLYMVAGLAFVAITTIFLVVRYKRRNQTPINYQEDIKNQKGKTEIDLANIERNGRDAENHAPTTQIPQSPISEPNLQDFKKCRGCGAEVPADRLICEKCGMLAGYL